MSNDKRMGVNPLSWVDPNATSKPQEPVVATAANAPTAPNAFMGNIFKPADTLTEEDLMAKGKIKIKKTMETAEAVTHLEDLAKSLASGVIRAESNGETIVLSAAETVKFEMKLSRKKDKAKCSIEMEWDDDGNKAEGFKISG